MSIEYDPNNRRKRVDMPTLSDVTLDKDLKPLPPISEQVAAQVPFDPSDLDEAAPGAESHSNIAESNKSGSARPKRASKSKPEAN